MRNNTSRNLFCHFFSLVFKIVQSVKNIQTC
ncbi:hypothetical protein [Escherichia phage BI-EHEC]|nr:hypothetical protein [Escherichia phage BI-EHEC]